MVCYDIFWSGQYALVSFTRMDKQAMNTISRFLFSSHLT